MQVLDCFLVYALLTAAVQARPEQAGQARWSSMGAGSPAMLQFLYMLLVGSFPFNSFLAGFIGTLAFFVLTGAPAPCAQSGLCLCCAAEGPDARPQCA